MPPEASRPGVLFDVDGTLVDTNYLHTLAWSRAFSDAGEWAPMNAIHRLVGMGGDQLVPRLLGHESEEATRRRPERYKELMPEAKAFPGAADLLRKVHSAGLLCVLATSSLAEELQPLVNLIGAEDALDGRTTADDVEASKPAPDVFETAMRDNGIDPGKCIAVGDSVWDIEAASAAGIACVGLQSGGFSRYELSDAGALAVYRDVAELDRRFWTSALGGLTRWV